MCSPGTLLKKYSSGSSACLGVCCDWTSACWVCLLRLDLYSSVTGVMKRGDEEMIELLSALSILSFVFFVICLFGFQSLSICPYYDACLYHNRSECEHISE